MLSKIVKVGAVTNLSDARYCAGMGVDLVGFPLDGPYAISIEDVKEITGWIEGVRLVAEYESTDINTIKSNQESFPFELIQVENEGLANDLIKEGYQIVLKTDRLPQDSTPFAYVIVDSRNENVPKNCLLGGESITKDSVQTLSVDGIHLVGSQEIRPGYKDFDELADILEVLEVD
ncbi:MAG: hypothetical protein AB8B61_09610 [Cyclobacteriaceae bacterium]